MQIGIEHETSSRGLGLYTDALSGYHFDHLQPETKNKLSIHDEFVKLGLRNIDQATAALRDSAMTLACGPCHDLGHMAGGLATR